MATSAVAMGKIEVQRRKGEPIPPGWALGENGSVTTNAAEACKVQKLLPLGGSEVTSGYKGILFYVDQIFCSYDSLRTNNRFQRLFISLWSIAVNLFLELKTTITKNILPRNMVETNEKPFFTFQRLWIECNG